MSFQCGMRQGIVEGDQIISLFIFFFFSSAAADTAQKDVSKTLCLSMFPPWLPVVLFPSPCITGLPARPAEVPGTLPLPKGGQP